MPRKKEPLETRLSRYLPGISILERNDPDCWVWQGKFRRRKPFNPLLGDVHPARAILQLWHGKSLHRMVMTKRVCGTDGCVNPYHYLLVGQLFDRFGEERYPVPHHWCDPELFAGKLVAAEAVDCVPVYVPSSRLGSGSPPCPSS